jgi:alkanesulfonate monooxygenase SsuD/methylene tetrahydromethanopterin reductase-like flavin-dependent oxidoreductase (luciferase family)
MNYTSAVSEAPERAAAADDVCPPLASEPDIVKFARLDAAHYPGDYAPDAYDRLVAKQLYDEITEEAVEAEELGWDGFFFTEHHFDAYSVSPSPNILLTHLAAKTKKIRLGAGVYILPTYDPVRLAEEAGAIDTLSQGRLEVGFGRGNFEFEIERFPMPAEEFAGRFDENLDVFMKAINNSHITHDGRFANVRLPLTSYPRPYQPQLPVWVAAVSPGSVERVGRLGHNLASGGFADGGERLARYVEASEKAGRNVSGANFMAVTSIVVAPTDAEAERIAERSSIAMLQSLNFRTKSQPEMSKVISRIAVCGSPQTVREQLSHLMAGSGARRILAILRLLGMNTQEVRQTQRLMAEEVMPALRSYKA